MTLSNAEYLIENARIFYDTGHHAMTSFYKLEGDQTSTHRSFITVAATNIHFAVELAFKALSGFTVQGFVPHKAGHNLLNLFDGLSAERKRDITREYEEKLYLSNRFVPLHGLATVKKEKLQQHLENYKSDLPEMLKQHKDGFVSWRYNAYGINDSILFFDYQALEILFKVLQSHVLFIIFQITDNDLQE